MLTLERIGIHDNFFDLGGHSLMLVELGNRLNEDLDLSVPVVDLFTYPTVCALAEHLMPAGLQIDQEAEVADSKPDVAAGKLRIQQLRQSRQRS